MAPSLERPFVVPNVSETRLTTIDTNIHVNNDELKLERFQFSVFFFESVVKRSAAAA